MNDDMTELQARRAIDEWLRITDGFLEVRPDGELAVEANDWREEDGVYGYVGAVGSTYQELAGSLPPAESVRREPSGDMAAKLKAALERATSEFGTQKATMVGEKQPVDVQVLSNEGTTKWTSDVGTTRWLVAKYISDLKRRDPVNVGLLVFHDGKFHSRFCDPEGGHVFDIDNYKAWVHRWDYDAGRVSSPDDVAGMMVQLPASNYYLEQGGSMPAANVHDAAAFANYLFGEVVGR